jgi:hypothetical protein
LPKVQSFADITSDPDLQQALATEYGSVDNIDLWVGALAENHLPGSSIGPLLTAIFQDQFTRLRDGDRFYFENDPSFSPFDVFLLKQTTLADVIRRNSGVKDIQSDVFLFGGSDSSTSTGLVATELVASALAPAGSLPANTGTFQVQLTWVALYIPNTASTSSQATAVTDSMGVLSSSMTPAETLDDLVLSTDGIPGPLD